MKRILIAMVMCFIFTVNFMYADDSGRGKKDANMSGCVTDAQTKECLPYITIQIKGTTIGTNTDASGHYFLKNLPSGKFTVVVQSLGYRTLEKEIVLEKGSNIEQNFAIQPSTISLDELVVSANRNETNRKLAPTLVSVLDGKMLEVTNSKNLFQALNFQPGLRVEDNCQNCGFSQVRINGLEGAYSQILIDSRPIYGALTGVYGLDQIPTNMIDRIEVIRGGGSALFGSSAIGGVINIITRQPSRNDGDFAHTFSSIDGGKAYENNTMFNASMVNDNRREGIMIYGQNRDRQGYDKDGDGFTEMPMLKNRSFGFRSFLKTGLYSSLTLEYHNMHEFRRGGDHLKLQPFQSEITEQLEHFINGGGINFIQNTPDLKNRFNLYTSAQHTLRKSYYGGGDPVGEIDTIKPNNDIIDNINKRLKSFGRSTERIYQVGGQYTRSIDNLLFLPAELTAGTEYLSNDLTDVSGYRTDDIDQKTHTTSAFIQNEWKNEKWSILIGGRLDKHSLVKSAIFSPRANIRFNPNGKVNFRLSYSEGFRAPQYFDEELHVDIANGEHIIRVLSDNLKEERSRSISGSIDYYQETGSLQFNILLEGFYTHLKDPFATDDLGGGKKLVVNAKDGAKVYGINMEGRMAYRHMFDLQMGLTLQRSLFDKARAPLEKVKEYREFMRSPNVYGYFVATWKPFERFAATLSGNYTGKMYVPHEAGSGVEGKDRFTPVNKVKNADAFFELHAKISYDIHIFDSSTLQLSTGVQNVFNSYQNDFDTGAGRASSYIYGPSMPRSLFFGMKMSF